MFFKKEEPINIKFSELLPIGTVVLLKDAEKKLMIDGIIQTDGGKGKTYDYAGVYYPEGNIGGDYHFLFNHEDIDTVIFRGYEDSERAEFIARLEKTKE